MPTPTPAAGPPRHLSGAGVEFEARHQPGRDALRSTEGQDQARVDVRDQTAAHGQRGHVADAARRQQQADHQHRIAVQAFQHGPDQHHGHEHRPPEHEHQDQADHEFRSRNMRMSRTAVRRPGCAPRTGNRRQREERHSRIWSADPVDPLAAVEHQLRGRDRHRERDEAEPVEPAARLAASLGHERQTPNRASTPNGATTKDTQRQLYSSSCRRMVGPSWPEHHADAPQRHGGTVLARGKVSSVIAWARGTSGAPNSPWQVRHRINSCSEWQTAQDRAIVTTRAPRRLAGACARGARPASRSAASRSRGDDVEVRTQAI